MTYPMQSNVADSSQEHDIERLPEPRLLDAAEIEAVAGGPQVTNGDQ